MSNAEKPAQKNPEQVVNLVSDKLREIIHEMNNALFVAKGFLEDLSDDVKEKRYQANDYDHENFVDMIATINRNTEKVNDNLNKLRKFAKEDLFELTGVHKS